MKSLSQQVDSVAYRLVGKARTELGAKEREEYGRWCQKLLSLISTSGLAQTMAFAEQKSAKEEALKILLRQLNNEKEMFGTQSLLQASSSLDPLNYMMLQRRMLLLLQAMKSFSISMLGLDDDTKGDQE